MSTHLHATPRRSLALTILTSLWFILFFAALFRPPLLDDADATHTNAARHILTSGDWVTLQVNGIRYLEKAPLPYWLVAISLRLFGFNAFAAHLPQAIGVLLLALLGYRWAAEAFGARAAFYTGLGVLTSVGVFLFTRIFIPEVWLSLFLATALYVLLKSLPSEEPRAPSETPGTPSQTPGVRLEPPSTQSEPPGAPTSTRGFIPGLRWAIFAEAKIQLLYPYILWTALALAVLTKGLVALVFFFGTAIVYLTLTAQWHRLRRLRPISGAIVFLAIAAPWHILAGLRNTNGYLGGHRHGFFWFYFVNEHFLRFLGRRIPMDYNKLPGSLFWSLHLIWLFPWSIFLPTAAIALWRLYKQGRLTRIALRQTNTFAQHTTLLLVLYSVLVLGFFSLSTNQEYYTFPAYLSILILLMAALANAETETPAATPGYHSAGRWLLISQAVFTVLGLAIASTLAYGLWTSRHLPFVPDIGSLLAHRGVGDYTLSMSHLFDLTGPSFAALRLPAALAAVAFAFGPAIAWVLRRCHRHLAATSTIAATTAIFLIAAHIALVRFGPMLSSEDMAETIQHLEATHAIDPNTRIMLYGDQAYGSSIPFYLGRQLRLVEGRSTSMLFGSSFPDAPHLFLADSDLVAGWGRGPRKLLFVPLEKRDIVDRLLGPHQIVLKETSGKALITDRPLAPTAAP